MRSRERARYEQALSLMARGARAAAAVLDEDGQRDAAWEFTALAAWTKSELDRSLANKKPMSGQLELWRGPGLEPA